jgi:hypothetical protein
MAHLCTAEPPVAENQPRMGIAGRQPYGLAVRKLYPSHPRATLRSAVRVV